MLGTNYHGLGGSGVIFIRTVWGFLSEVIVHHIFLCKKVVCNFRSSIASKRNTGPQALEHCVCTVPMEPQRASSRELNALLKSNCSCAQGCSHLRSWRH